MTAAVRDLAIEYPRRFEVHVAGSCSQLWRNSPWVAGVWGTRRPRGIPSLRISNEPLFQADHGRLHYLTSFHRTMSNWLGVEIPVLQPHGDVHLDPDELTRPLVSGRYWVLVAGGKADIRTKIWPYEWSQLLVKELSVNGIRIVQAGATYPGHEHPQLQGVINFVGRTDLRGLLRLIQHSDGVICPVTFAMHAAAALRKPCVVIAGGREPCWWAAYTNSFESTFGPRCKPLAVPHRFLHTIGQFDCCSSGGCWKSRLSKTPALEADCLRPRLQGRQLVAECMTALSPEIVADAVISYSRSVSGCET